MRKFLLSAVLIIFFLVHTFAQEKTIIGKVVDSRNRLPLQGVSLTIKGSNISTQTNADGNFTITASPGSTLVFTSVGFRNQEVIVGKSNITVSLQEQARELSEVVVTALGVSREKRTLGYSTTTIKNEELNRVSPVSIFDGLQGKVAGVDDH